MIACSKCKSPLDPSKDRCPRCGSLHADSRCPHCGKDRTTLVGMAEEWCEDCMRAVAQEKDHDAETRQVEGERWITSLQLAVVGLGLFIWLYPAPFKKAWRWIAQLFS